MSSNLSRKPLEVDLQSCRFSYGELISMKLSSSFIGSVFFLCLLADAELSINEVTLLLPFSAVPAYYTDYRLEATGGCFTWHNGNPALISISPVRDPQSDSLECFSVAYVKANVAPGTRKSAWVWAQDKHTGQRVECEVFVASIRRLEILTNTRVINVGDMESIDIQGFDDDENVFSTLDGLPFQWRIKDERILRRVSLSDAGMQLPARLKSLETEGVLGKLIVQGMNTGKSVVTVQLSESSHSAEPVAISFSVVEPLYLEPVHAYICPASELQLTLQTRWRAHVSGTSSRSRKPILMPSAQYKWNSTNNTAISVDHSMGLAIGLDIGFSQVIVADTNLAHHKQQADLFVVHPVAIVFELTAADETSQFRPMIGPCNHWYLMHHSKYLLRVKLVDENDNFMVIANNMVFRVRFDGDSIHPFDYSSNNAVIQLDAATIGTTNFTAHLSFVYSKKIDLTYNLPLPVYASQSMSVVERIQVTPAGPIAILWTGCNAKKESSLQIRASGGSGTYQFHSSTPLIIPISEKGVISPVSAGSCTITVSDRQNPENMVTVDVTVLIPDDLIVLPGPREAQIGSTMQLSIGFSVNSISDFSYTHCSHFDLKSMVSEGSSVSLSQSSSPSCTVCPSDSSTSCFVVNINTLACGFSSVRFSLPMCVPDKEAMTTTATVSVFPALVASPHELLVGVGSLARVSWSGGPVPWPGTHDPVYTVDSSSIYRGLLQIEVQAPVETEGARATAQVTCLDIHEQRLTVSAKNRPCDSNPNPVECSVHVKLACYHKLLISPRKLVLGVGVEKRAAVQTDHPLINNVTFYVSDSHHASVTSDGRVRGLSLGQTTLHASINGSSDQGGLHDSIPILVQFEGFSILSPSRTILQGEETSICIQGINGEQPSDLSFEGVECVWEIDSSSVIIVPPLWTRTSTRHSSLMASNSRTAIGHSMAVVGVSPGTVRITAKITVTGSFFGYFEQTAELTVLAPLTLISPSPMLLPLHAMSYIVTSLDDSHLNLNYDILGDHSLITVSNNGKVTAGSKAGDAVVLIKAEENTNTAISTRNSAAVLVTVGEVKELSIHPANQLPPKIQISAVNSFSMTVGSNITAHLLLRDALGRMFSSIHGWNKDSVLSYSSSHSERVRVQRKGVVPGDNGAILDILDLLALSEGRCVVSIRLDGGNDTISPLFIHINVTAHQPTHQSTQVPHTVDATHTPPKQPATNEKPNKNETVKRGSFGTLFIVSILILVATVLAYLYSTSSTSNSYNSAYNPRNELTHTGPGELSSYRSRSRFYEDRTTSSISLG